MIIDRIFKRKIVLAVITLSLLQNLYSSTCQHSLFEVSSEAAKQASSIKKWISAINEFFNSSNPDWAIIRPIVEEIEKFDTSSSGVRANLTVLSEILESHAHRLTEEAPAFNSTESQLKNRSNQLRLLNRRAFRNLLSSEEIRTKVGVAAWNYNRAIWNSKLNLVDKIAEISRAIPFETIIPRSAPVSSSTFHFAVHISSGDLFTFDTEAFGTSIECSGLCSESTNFQLKKISLDLLKDRHFQDGESQTALFSDTSGKKRNFVFIVDDQKQALHHLVKSILLEAENSGFKSISLPIFRTGYAFGAVEINDEQIIDEISEGLTLFSQESVGKLTDIHWIVKNDGALEKKVRSGLSHFGNTRERSLRTDLREALLSRHGFVLGPSPIRPKVINRDSPIYKTILLPWDLAHMMEVHAPLKIGSISNREDFNRPSVSVLNMPIKMPGSNFRIPDDLSQFRELLQKMIDHEIEINPDLDKFYAYLTVDHNTVKAGSTHRRGGVHIDGIQGSRYPVKLPPEHTYSASNGIGTVFYLQPFDLRDLDPAKQHVHAELERQAKPESRFQTKEYDIYFWDSYSVHEAALAERDFVRTFVRIEFSKKIYDSKGDTKNPLFDYHWIPVARPIPADLDDRPLPKRYEQAGYSHELDHIKANTPHTVKNLRAYLSDNLGAETLLAAEAGEAEFLVGVGEGTHALNEAQKIGWSIDRQIQKKEGFHRIFLAKSPAGSKGYLIQRVNGDDRVLHVQSLLKLAGAPEIKVRTIGKSHSWRSEYLKTFRSLGYLPDLVVYGFSNTMIDSTLLRNAFKNGRHFATLKRNYAKKLTGIAGRESTSDLDGMNFQILELADGRKIWFFHCLFGDLVRDLISSLSELGAKNMTFIGSAGSLDPDIPFGSLVIPALYRNSNGIDENLHLPKMGTLHVGGTYKRVPTPNVGTREWITDMSHQGIDFIESEFGHVIEELKRYPDIKLRAALVISEIATGPMHRDMTEWGLADLRKLFPSLNQVMDASLENNDPSLYVIKSYKSVPLVSKP